MASAWGSSWNGAWGDSWGGVLAAVLAPVGGRRRQRTVYFIDIDGVRIECGTLREALAQLAQQRVRAIQAMQEAAKEEIPIVPAPPKIVTSHRELHPVLAQIKEDLRLTYQGALRDAEIKLLMTLADREEDETLLLLM